MLQRLRYLYMELPPKDEDKGNVNPDEIEIDPLVVKFLAQWQVDIPIEIQETQGMPLETIPAPERTSLAEASVLEYETIVFHTGNSAYILHDNEDGNYSFTKIPGDGVKINPQKIEMKYVPMAEVGNLVVRCGERTIFGPNDDYKTTYVVTIDAGYSVKRGK